MIGGSRWVQFMNTKRMELLYTESGVETSKEDLKNTVSKSTISKMDFSTQQDTEEIEVNEQIEPNIEPCVRKT